MPKHSSIFVSFCFSEMSITIIIMLGVDLGRITGSAIPEVDVFRHLKDRCAAPLLPSSVWISPGRNPLTESILYLSDRLANAIISSGMWRIAQGTTHNHEPPVRKLRSQNPYEMTMYPLITAGSKRNSLRLSDCIKSIGWLFSASVFSSPPISIRFVQAIMLGKLFLSALLLTSLLTAQWVECDIRKTKHRKTLTRRKWHNRLCIFCTLTDQRGWLNWSNIRIPLVQWHWKNPFSYWDDQVSLPLVGIVWSKKNGHPQNEWWQFRINY